jgi:HPt (histidine-containing phosphotransfer) domain-containing protein
MSDANISCTHTTALRHKLMTEEQLEQICSQMEQELRSHDSERNNPVAKALADRIRPVATKLRTALQYKLDKKDLARIREGLVAFALEMQNKLYELIGDIETL